jgi:predicted RecB family nuclease
MRLSKSRFIAGMQCLKRLYLQVHQPELASEPDEQSLAVFEQGHEVGRWAQKAFPGGVLIESGPEEMSKALELTGQAVADKQHPAIFEATFTHDNILARVDILERLSGNKWRLIEVKSSTRLKDYYLYDLAIQKLILENLGMEVASCLMHLNREYVYDGKQYELEKLFVIRDLTDEIAALEQNVKDLIREEWEVLAQVQPPDIEPGKHCSSPFGCEFFDVCNRPLPVDDIANLPGISVKKLQQLASQGIESIGNIPEDFSLTERQRHAWECARTGKPWFGKGLKGALAELRYPLYFMDFETLGVALPRYAGMSPYDQIPFQWSVHVQHNPGSEPEHYEFLADDSRDPRPEFIKTLCQVMGKTGSVLAYNSTFESACLESLAENLPQYQDEIRNIQGRLWDPWPVIRAHVYDMAFRGSYSLKSVLPALVPGMTYEGMAIAEGNEAGLAWEKMVRAEVGSEERRRLRDALLAYCHQDTLAMVRLVEVLQAV